MNYRILGLEDINGKHGGSFSVHREVWNPSLGLGSMLGFGHSRLGFLHSLPAQYEDCDFSGFERYVIALCFLASIVGLVGLHLILVMVPFALCLQVAKCSKGVGIVAHG